MINRLRKVLLILILFLGMSTSPSTGFSNIQTNLQIPENDGLQINQMRTPIEDIFSNSFDILISRKNLTNSWILPSFAPSNDQLVFRDTSNYTGIAGGAAGLGMALLDALAQDSSWVSDNTNAILLDIAEEIGAELIDLDTHPNSTHASWNITLESEIVDISYDFGLSGIASFFIELYNHTDNLTYLNFANQTINTIFDLTNASTSFGWSSKLMQILASDNLSDWYPNLEYYSFAPSEPNPQFTGISTGIGGVANTMINFLHVSPINYQTNAEKILNESITWLENQMEVDTLEIAIGVAVEYPELKSTSIATGMAGFGELFLNLYKYTANQTHLDHAIGIMHWLNGTNLEIPRYEFSFQDNGSISIIPTLEAILDFGLQYGMGGIAKFFFELGSELSSTEITSLSKTVLQYIINFGLEDVEDETLSFSFRYVINETLPHFPQSQQTTSWARGTSGIFQLSYLIGTELNDNGQFGLIQNADKMKRFIVSYVTSENDLTLVKDRRGLLENNPSNGIPGIIRILGYRINGELDVSISQIHFGDVEIGKSVSQSIPISNIGEADILVTWNDLSGSSPFITPSFSTTIGSYQSEDLFVSFIPTEEVSYSAIISISSQGNEFEVALSGNGFDIPSLTHSSSIANNTFLSSHRNIRFELSAIDSSLIDKSQARVTVNGQVNLLESSPNSNDFSFDWNTGNLANGTYSLVFIISDVNGKSAVVTYVYEIGVYTSDFQDKVFSDTTRNFLIGFVIILIIAAGIGTKLYMNKS